MSFGWAWEKHPLGNSFKTINKCWYMTFITINICPQMYISTLETFLFLFSSIFEISEMNVIFSSEAWEKHPLQSDFFNIFHNFTVDEEKNRTNIICSYFIIFCPIDFIFIMCVVEDERIHKVPRNFDCKPTNRIF